MSGQISRRRVLQFTGTAAAVGVTSSWRNASAQEKGPIKYWLSGASLRHLWGLCKRSGKWRQIGL